MAVKLLRTHEGRGEREAGTVAPDNALSGEPGQLTEQFFTNAKESFPYGIGSSGGGKREPTCSQDAICEE
ncbi:hypothetical protein [Microbulbifer sediminum]|uniref:hypothetical protein n=1 Tax=Microbulbifer sediminum TaxID=2904250 RepID=UPI001F20CCD7|nr:hypothetical protein [Microbulbifer sediminum]